MRSVLPTQVEGRRGEVLLSVGRHDERERRERERVNADRSDEGDRDGASVREPAREATEASRSARHPRISYRAASWDAKRGPCHG